MLLDSNILIDSVKPSGQWARDLIAAYGVVVSSVSVVEVLGYHKLQPQDEQDFRRLFATATIHPITDDVIWRAVDLRQRRRMDLGDALIAATALIHGLTLATRNTADFIWVPGLSVLDPRAP